MARTATQLTQARGTQRRGGNIQNHASQSQRHQRRDGDGEEEEEEEEDDNMEEDGQGGNADEDFDRKANALVRLALFNESRRMPLRREEINKKLFGQGGSTRTFNHILSMAQKKLQSSFGMELVELSSRAERDKDIFDGEDGDDLTGVGSKKKSASKSKSYILRSTLASEIIEIASRADEVLIEEEFPREDEDDSAPSTFGTIISWSTSDHLGGLGLLHVILSLILVNGRVLSDPELKKYLRALHLEMSSTIEAAPHATQRSSSIEVYLANLVKQGFLDRIRLGSGGAPQPTQGKRGRPSQAAGDEENVTYEWRWGARAYAEVGEEAIATFMAEFMAEQTLRGNEDDDEDRRRPSEQETEKIVTSVRRDITRAAGGQLKGLT